MAVRLPLAAAAATVAVCAGNVCCSSNHERSARLFHASSFSPLLSFSVNGAHPGAAFRVSHPPSLAAAHGIRAVTTCRAALLQSENTVPQKQDLYVVGDFMTQRKDLLVAKASTTVDEALEALVENRITGMPVVDDDDKLVGVVSDYDLLALDSISGKRTENNGLFPEAGSTWKAFKEIQKLLTKTHGRTVGDVMSPSPLVVRAATNLEDAARLLLDSRYRRLPVVDDSGKLVGLLTRGNVVRAALQIKQAGETK